MRAFYSVPLALLALALAAPVSAAVPSAANSTVPLCLQMCPLGDLNYTVVVRDIANNPVGGSTVVLDFSSCPAVHLCPPPNPTTTQVTNALGVATFAVRGGGGCTGLVRVFADGILISPAAGGVSVASPDQDGSLFVNGADQALLLTKGSSDATADLNCDGTHDAADGNVITTHMGHFCDGVVPVAPSSWGQLKLHYH